MRNAALSFAVVVATAAVGCQTTAPAHPSTAPTEALGTAPAHPSSSAPPHASPAAPATPAGVDTRPVEATSLRPAAPAPVATHARCDAQVFLRLAAPIHFEDHVVSQLREVELEVQGPPGLRFFVDHHPSMDGVALTPLVALRLPAGPAVDSPSGSSGALFDWGGLALAAVGNLLLLPLTLPLGLLVGQPEAFFFDAPRFTDGMFSDVVLDQRAWQTEVQRRAAPHKEALAQEALRQKRFQTWRNTLGLTHQTLTCTTDADGRCGLRLLWPLSSVEAEFAGLPCAVPPAEPTPPATGDDDTVASSAPPRRELTWILLPSLPEPTPPQMLEVPPRDADDRRGVGADRTAVAWGVRPPRLESADAAFLSKAPQRGRRGQAVDDATLACRVRAKGGGFDIDGSGPELRARVAWGFDHDVVGFTFAGPSDNSGASGAVPGVSLVPGELVKLSVVDVDALVDDWVGMDIVRFDGTWPLRFAHRRFVGECRIGADARPRESDPDRGLSL